MPIPQFPHCDQRVLHKPKSCTYCDAHPQWQELREAWGINFTGETDPSKAPCPATFVRPLETIHGWPGNQPTRDLLLEFRVLWTEHDRLTRIEFGDPEGLSHSEGLRLQQVRKDIRLATISIQVDALLETLTDTEEDLKSAKTESNMHRDKWIEYERDYVLPTFQWATEEGINLQELVRTNPGFNCVALLVRELRKRLADADEGKVTERRENGRDRDKTKDLERQLSMVKTDRENVWMWQQADNDLPSLSCPVVMEAEHLRKLLEVASLEGAHVARRDLALSLKGISARREAETRELFKNIGLEYDVV